MDTDNKRLFEIPRSVRLTGHVHKRTHRQCQLLNLVNTQGIDDHVGDLSVLSDDFLINTDVSLEWLFLPAMSVTYIKY